MIMFLLLISLNLQGQDILDLLPSKAELTGWTVNINPEIYSGEKLYELIDGGADIYLEYGFKQVVTVHYADPSQNNIQLEIYEMTDAPSAYGIFSLSQQTAEWSAQYGALSAIKADYISFWKDRYYVTLSWSSRQRLDTPKLEKLANMIADKITGKGDYPAIIKSFQALDPGKKVVFLEGNLALSNFYYFDYKDIFKIKEALGCSPGRYHKILIKYPDQAGSVRILADAKQSMLNNKRFTDVVVSFQGYSCRDNKGNLIMVRQVENYIAILVSLDNSLSLLPIMDEITLNIENSENR